MDPNSLARRAIALEEAQRKVWLNIAKKDIPRVYKYTSAGYQAKMAHHRKLSTLILLQSKKVATRTNKSGKDVQVKAKRLMREMLVFWRKNDKEERDIRKKAEKEAMDKAKHEEEKREAQRQARKLEFLITQTELYSHFVGNKLKTSEHEETAETAGAPKPPPPAAAVGDENEEEMGSAELDDLDFNDEDNTNLHRHARRNAKEAIELARQRAQAFDVAAAEDRKKNEAIARAKDGDDSEEAGSSAPLVDLDSEELNFQNPTSMGEPMVVSQPKMLMAQLKEYQLKGLNWLATLYEQGINGILADEMGLGKTVQSISLLAYLAETHDIWGPFLVIAPASTLHNWQQEITRFVPALKALPYWGNVKDRATLRKFWNKKQISYNQDAPFHVLITSYQLVVQDEKYFQRVKWQYMVLDEAQAIKSSTSARWKTLLGFNCRNRLLLTGTPIQNSMQELWALLHFIMPSLFDSHDEFSEWFSKDIENHAENKGSNLNEHQLRRLHMILKPFMLRRVKKHVQNELGDKIEIDMYCDLSPRQRALYRGLRNNVSVAELLAKAANLSDADSAMSLMNLVMQFRKVCNHPELFERADVTAPLAFSTFGQALGKIRDGDVLYCPYSTRNPIEFSIPELFYRDGGLLDVPGETSPVGPDTRWLGNLMNIWSNDWIEKSLESSASAFSFLPLLDISPAEAHTLYTAPPIRRLLMASQEDAKLQSDGPYFDPDFAVSQTGPFGQISTRRISHLLDVADGSSPLSAISTDAWTASYLSRSEIRWFSEPVAAPPIGMYCRDRTFVDRQARICESYLDSLGLFGLPPSLKESPEAFKRTQALLPGLPPTGIVGSSSADQLPLSSMQVPEAKRLIYDSAKLARLDLLLQELKQGDHRVLIYFQMTRMIDLMEEYLIYRQYKYLRLDGSSKLEDRRDMVTDWQTRPDIFIFLLSTRAGGLGINLTAADTVVFYDHDWNPSNDSQAMDRAHRLGQTRQVTVYRLITRGTIDERIVQLARVKKDVQDIVVGNKQFTDTTKPNEIVSLLLNDDELALANIPQDGAAVSTSEAKGNTGRAEGEDESASASLRDMWLDEGDEFFGHVVGAGSTNTPPEADGQLPASQPQQASGKKTAQAPGNKPRKSTGKRQSHKKKPGPATGDSLPTEL
ncbi:hypothetical protein BOTBODRAFT_101773 [Botryobasidium botryosum FD-172 SS1]|uniref:Chromatin-remodeling ATPase INO80 n=1 Tax=Botryobasidium botryosum (strain FD-172 SS1) TaxID=930990 RepID=A0A067MW15_BOTB1|nr:hypothetical protein BOTBODRAFT_101773 [Botryobasidium botryosum FD-172 SS1]